MVINRNPLNHRETSFGFMEVLAEADGKPLVEFLHFERNGRSHSHDEWEVVSVTAGGGKIMVGEKVVEVRTGDTCRIPPHTLHWMEPDGSMDILISYFQE
jgi:quercetin dioxygenase-like cupin family protein